jgi:hypothetical protein
MNKIISNMKQAKKIKFFAQGKRTVVKKQSKGLGIILAVLLFVPVLAFTGCASMSGTTSSTTSASGMSAGNMQMRTRMSASIFLQPVPPQEKVVYVSVRNTSSASGLSFRNTLEGALMARGYRITNNPQEAYFMVMSNVLYIGKETRSYTMAGALVGGFGGALIGSTYGNVGSTLAGAGIGAVAGALIGSAFSSKRYMMVVDIQLEQRQQGTYTTNSTAASQGTASTTTTYNAGVKNWAIYRDRIVAQASAINLQFSSAEPALKSTIGREIANLL